MRSSHGSRRLGNGESIGRVRPACTPGFPRDSPEARALHNTGNGELSITCGNRHCPKCQSLARAQWIARREAELLNTPYFHVVFTVPDAIAAIALHNKRVVYNLLFRVTADTLRTIAADPKHLGAQIGVALIRLRRHFPKGGYDGIDGQREETFTGTAELHG